VQPRMHICRCWPPQAPGARDAPGHLQHAWSLVITASDASDAQHIVCCGPFPPPTLCLPTPLPPRPRCTADCGWITGHSFLAYGPLLRGATAIIFGSTPPPPNPGRCWQIVEKYKVRFDRGDGAFSGDPQEAGFGQLCGSQSNAGWVKPNPLSQVVQLSGRRAAAAEGRGYLICCLPPGACSDIQRPQRMRYNPHAHAHAPPPAGAPVLHRAHADSLPHDVG
jgi:hypothetical protein